MGVQPTVLPAVVLAQILRAVVALLVVLEALLVIATPADADLEIAHLVHLWTR